MHDIPKPSDAVRVDLPHPSGLARGFTGTTRQVERTDLNPVDVVVFGVQYASWDKPAERWIFVRGVEGPMTPAEARRLARLLIAAADEIQLYAQEGI